MDIAKLRCFESFNFSINQTLSLSLSFSTNYIIHSHQDGPPPHLSVSDFWAAGKPNNKKKTTTKFN